MLNRRPLWRLTRPRRHLGPVVWSFDDAPAKPAGDLTDAECERAYHWLQWFGDADLVDAADEYAVRVATGHHATVRAAVARASRMHALCRGIVAFTVRQGDTERAAYEWHVAQLYPRRVA